MPGARMAAGVPYGSVTKPGYESRELKVQRWVAPWVARWWRWRLGELWEIYMDLS